MLRSLYSQTKFSAHSLRIGDRIKVAEGEHWAGAEGVVTGLKPGPKGNHYFYFKRDGYDGREALTAERAYLLYEEKVP